MGGRDIQDIARREGNDKDQVVLHSDNGSPTCQQQASEGHHDAGNLAQTGHDAVILNTLGQS